MDKPKVFVTRKIPGNALSLLKKHFSVRVYTKDQAIPRKELLKSVKWCDALLCMLTEKIDREIIEANPNLKIISNYAVGYDNIDVEYATKKGIPVCNTPNQEVANAVAEHTFALMLNLAKHLHESDEYVRKHEWKAWKPELFLGEQVKGKIIGIVGLGRIGCGVAERAAHGMGMNTLYYDVIRNPKFEKEFKAKYVSLNTLLKKADFITLHVPLLPSTKHLIGRKQFAMMKNTAYLINTSRGPVIDEKALIHALKSGQIGGAGLDVYEKEPDVNPELTKLKNVILTPHTASATIEVRLQMSKDAAESIIAFFKGMKVLRVVNSEVFKK